MFLSYCLTKRFVQPMAGFSFTTLRHLLEAVIHLMAWLAMGRFMSREWV